MVDCFRRERLTCARHCLHDRYRLLHPNKTFEEVTNRHKYPVFLRPLFSTILNNLWSLVSSIQLACQLTMGVALPVAGKALRFPMPIILGSVTLKMSAIALLTAWPTWEVISYVYPYVNNGFDLVKGHWIQPWSTEWGHFRFCLSVSSSSVGYALVNKSPRIYIPATHTPQIASRLSHPPVADDDHTSGSTSDPDACES